MDASFTLSLNDEQLRVVNHRGSPLRVIAGAGTGKTATLTGRFVSLVENNEAEIGQILALTFTRKAANEMKTRILDQLDRSYTEFWVETFHSFCTRVLRLEHAIRNEPPPILLDGEARRRLLQSAIDGEHFPAYGTRREDLERHALTFIDRAKDELLTVDDALDLARKRNNPQFHDLARAYALYQRRLQQLHRVYDWGELQTRLLDMFEDETVLQRWSDKFRFILVDEYQDVNEAQCRLIESLAGDGTNLTVVGDVDQSIYAFRGASHRLLTGMPDRFPNTTTEYLTSNYRSHQAILDAGSALISRNPDLHQRRQLVAHDGRTGALPTVIEARDEQEEADAIARQIARLHYIEGVPLQNIAVLLRSAQTSATPIEQALAAYGLLATFSADVQPSGDAASDVLSVLTLLDGDDDGHLIHLLTSQGIDPLQVLSADLDQTDDGAGIVERLTRLDPEAGQIAAQTVRRIHLLNERSLPEQVYEAARICGRLPLGTAITRDDYRYMQSLRGLIERAQQIVETGGNSADLVQEITAAPAIRVEVDPDDNGVQILTVHAAKGLEFDYVFVAGLAHGRFPLRRRLDRGLDLTQPESLKVASLDDLADDAGRRTRFLEEERRLGYVALTRAISALYLSFARSYQGTGSTHSVFLSDIETTREDLVERLSILATDESTMNARELTRTQHEQIFAAMAHPELSGDAIADVLTAQLTLCELPEASPWRCRAEPFPYDGTESLRLSYTAMSTYQTCPRRYYYANVLRLSDDSTSAYLVRGNVLHDAIQWMNLRRKQNDFPRWTDLADFVDANWPKANFDSPAQEQQIRRQCEQLLRRFHAYEQQVEREILGVELSLEGEIGHHAITGRIDCVSRMPDGTLEIIDYKSGKSAPTKAEQRLQLGLYQLAYRQLDPDASPRAVIYLLGNEADRGGQYAPELDPRKQIKSLDYDPDTLDDVEEQVHDVATRILRNEFPVTTNPNTCTGCAYRVVCEGAGDNG